MPSAHCHVRFGNIDTDKQIITKDVESRNFSNEFIALFPKVARDSIAYGDLTKLKSSGIIVNCSMNDIIQLVMKLDESSLQDLRLILLDRDVSHEDSLCIARGVFHLRLTSPTYESTGFLGKRSQFSMGNKVVHQQLYDVNIDLNRGLKSLFESNDRNTCRLLWFAEKTKTHKDRFYITSDRGQCDELVKLIKECSITYEIRPIPSKHMDIGLCNIPDLDIPSEYSDSFSQETLEWITYCSIKGPQLFPFDSTDEYVSSYKQQLDVGTQDRISMLQMSGGLISTPLILRTIHTLMSIHSIPWFAIVIHGVKDCNTSYGPSTCHSFVDDGTNDTVMLFSGKRYMVWDVCDSGDSHQ